MQQLSLVSVEQVEPASQEFDVNAWETPDPVAKYMAAQVLPTDKRILEPAAGRGQIAKFLPGKPERDLYCNEIKLDRMRELYFVVGERGLARCSDFLAWDYDQVICEPFDLILTNPPFNLALPMIEQSLRFLNRDNPTARLLYLLPCDCFQSQARAQHFARLDCRIYQRHSIVGRVAYLKDGVAIKGRQLSDTVFDIRPGKEGDCAVEKFVAI